MEAKKVFSIVHSLLKKLKRFFPAPWYVDMYLRYHDALDFINQKNPKSLCEVGGGNGGIAIVGYKKALTIVELHVPQKKTIFPNIKWITASAMSLPFRPDSWECVLSIDMLEHILPNHRDEVLTELIRVAQRFLIIAFPTGNQANRVEAKARKWYRKTIGTDMPQLKEHLFYGLPDISHVLESIKLLSPEAKITVLSNINVHLWSLIHYAATNNFFYWFFRTGSFFLMPMLLIIDIFIDLSESYRKVLIIEKKVTQ